MPWGDKPDLAAIAVAVGGRLEGAAITADPWRRRVAGAWRGRAVVVHCRRMREAYEWVVDVEAGALPLRLVASPMALGERALIRGGVLPAVPTGDAAFDARWTLRGAPARTLARVVDATLREALGALGEAETVSLTFEHGDVKVRSQGSFGAEEVMAGVEAAVCAAERVDALARERAAGPPTAEELAAERNEMTVTAEGFFEWLKPRMTPPLWALAGVLLVATWLSNNTWGHETAGVVVAAVDLAGLLVPLVLWKRSQRDRLGG